MSRLIGEVYPHAYYVVKRNNGAELAVWGPYATKSAAKGQRSSREANHRRWEGATSSTSFGIVESPAGQWTEVTL